MTAETLTGTRAASTFQVYRPSGAGALAVAYGHYNIAANVEAGDIFNLCKLPAGAVVVDGVVRAADLDTGTEALDMDVGWAANGTEAAVPDGFGNFGVWTGDAVTDIKPEVCIYLPLNGTLKNGPVSFTNETTITLTANVAAATFAAGTVTVVIYYVVP